MKNVAVTILFETDYELDHKVIKNKLKKLIDNSLGKVTTVVLTEQESRG